MRALPHQTNWQNQAPLTALRVKFFTIWHVKNELIVYV